MKRTARKRTDRRAGSAAGKPAVQPAGKKYAIHWQNDEPVAYEVNGVRYKTLDDVPDPADQEKLMALEVGWDDDLDVPEIPSIPLERVLLPVFIGVTVLMLAIAIYSANVVGRGLSREQETTGEVLDFVTRRSEEGTTFYYPIVRFALPDGDTRTVEMSEGSAPPAYAPLQRVTVRYNPADVAGAYVKSFSNTLTRYTVTLVTGILAVAFVLATVLTVWVTKKVPDMEALPPEDEGKQEDRDPA